MAAAIKNRGASKAKKSQEPVQQREYFAVGKKVKQSVPKPDLEVDYEISFWAILELLFNAEQGKYQIRNWGKETLEFEGEIPPGGFVSFHKKGSLSHIEIFRTTIGDIEKFWKGQMDVLSLRPKIYINLAALLQILDEQGTPLINPATGRKVVFYDIETEYGTIEAWQILYTKLYKGPHFTKNSQFSPLIREYWERSGAAQIQSWEDRSEEEEDDYESIMMGGQTPRDSVDKPDSLRLRQILAKLPQDVAEELAQALKVEVPDMSLKDLVLDDMNSCGCDSYAAYADELTKDVSNKGVRGKLLEILKRIDKGGLIGYDDDLNAVFLLAKNLRDPNGDPFDGDVKKLIDYVHQKAR